jgi:hypothetical protein
MTWAEQRLLRRVVRMYDAAERIYGCQESGPLLTFWHRKDDLSACVYV